MNEVKTPKPIGRVTYVRDGAGREMLRVDWCRGRVAPAPGSALFTADQFDATIAALQEQVRFLRGVIEGCRLHKAELLARAEAADRRAAQLEFALQTIGDKAHDQSTGPAVPDALWEIRALAYDSLQREVATGPTTEVVRIPRSEKLDPITVYLDDTGPGAGRATIACYGQAWTCSWGAMGDRTVRQFIAACGEDYLAACMASLAPSLGSKREREYARRVADAVIGTLCKEGGA